MKLLLGDCIEVMGSLEANSIDAIVTDPPYGWRFMGKAWDAFDIEKKGVDTRNLKHEGEWRIGSDGKRRRYGKLNVPNTSAGSYDTSITGNQAFQEFTEGWAKEAFRILKPGGYMLVFCGPRTYHRMASGVEDAGFEIRDQLQWLFGSGFPKSLDISKAIDRAMGAERPEVHDPMAHLRNKTPRAMNPDGQGKREAMYKATGPATDIAKQWQGFGTALKPANEPIVLARKPLSEKTVAANVLKWGTGGLNIDACRIPGIDKANAKRIGKDYTSQETNFGDKVGQKTRAIVGGNLQGRFPANLIFDEDAALMLDEQSGNRPSAGSYKQETLKTEMNKGGLFGIGSNKDKNGRPTAYSNEQGGASRFFYIAKASKRERNKGCERILSWESVDLNQSMESLNQLLKDISEDTMQLLRDMSWSTDLYGHSISEQYPPGLIFTIETVLKLITELKILNASQSSNIKESTLNAIKMIEENGLNLAASVEFLNKLDLTTINEKTGFLLGVSNAVLKTLLSIREKGKSGAFHPTIKPIKLMEYLCKLITPPGGIILDPFMGSGTTGIAAKNLGFEFIGIEKESQYLEIAKARID